MTTARGFTLIELMIVVMIIAVIAAIAVPNLLQSRLVTNETAAIANLRAYRAAQAIFILTDFDGDGERTYAPQFRDLYYTTSGGQVLTLIDKQFADATDAASPKAGYFFEDLSTHETEGDFNPAYGFGLAALPAGYDRTGRRSFVIGVEGVVYGKDQKSNDSLEGVYPDGSDWQAVPR